ncbi:MAG TPA: hypothetical protein DEP48_00750 [Persephonella sp.]|nr:MULTISPECIES: hypothetical protein [Persephonella]HCB68863.1 hypothetical protein [Persephonella sp.]
MLDNYNSKSGSYYQYTLEDFRNGKVDKTLEALKKEITKMEQIPGYLESEQRNKLYNNFKQQYKDLTELKNKYDEAANNTLVWNMYNFLKRGRENSIATPEVKDGGLFGNDPSAVDKTTGKPIFEK